MASVDLGDNSESFSDRVAQAILEATAGGASESQLEILAQARDLGQVTFDQAREATFNTIDCFENAGLSSEYIEDQEPSGFLLPSYGVQAEVEGLTDDQTLGLIDGCDRHEGFWVNYLYQTQPSTQELREAHFVSLLPQIRECLAANGKLVEEDATSDEVKLAMSELMVESSESGSLVSCASEVGVGPH